MQASGKEYTRSSPLLNLPGEIRESIYRATLGDRVLHIGFKDRLTGRWTIVICKGSSLGEEIHDEDVTDITHGGTSSSRGVLAGEALCEGCGSESVQQQSVLESDLGLRLLQTCRQIYDEASNIFWSTTTFAFRSSRAFELWLDQRSGYGARLIRSLQFNILSNGDKRHGVNDWNQVLGSGRVQRLVGLRHLRLVIRQSMLTEAHQVMKKWGIMDQWHPSDPALHKFCSYDYHWPGRQHLIYLKSLKKLATLALAKVEVSVRDSSPASDSHLMWSLEDRQEYARAVRDALLDPEGAAIYARDIPWSIVWSGMTSHGQAYAAEMLDIFGRLQCGALNRYESQF